MVLLFGFAFCSEKVSRTPTGNWEVHCLRNAVLGNQCKTFHKLNAMLSAAFVTLVGTWKSCIDIILSKPDITVTNGLLNQFWRSRESPEPSVPYRLKWEPAYCISMMFFPLNSIMGVCFFPPCPHHVMFLWKVFHKWFAQTSCVIWDALTKTLSARRKKKKPCYLQTANSLPQGFADFISGALLFGFHSLGFEATIKAYVWYCVMWFRPREKQSFIF